MSDRDHEFGGDHGHGVRDADLLRDVAADAFGDDRTVDVRDADLSGAVVPDPLARDRFIGVRAADQPSRVAGDPLGDDRRQPVRAADQSVIVAPDPLARDQCSNVRDADHARRVAGERTRPKWPRGPVPRPAPAPVAVTIERVKDRYRELVVAQRTRVAIDNRFSAYIRGRILKVSPLDDATTLKRAALETARIRRALAAYIRRRILEPPPLDDETTSKRAAMEIARIRRALPAGTDPELAIGLMDQAIATAEGVAPFVALETRRRGILERLAATLPGADFVRSVRGFGLYSFATLVGEAGDVGSYASQAALWKRLGLAVIDEGDKKVRQQRRTDKLLAEMHGFSPSRRAVSWNVFDTLLRAQSGLEGEVGKTGKPRVPRAPGPYRLIYDATKARALAKGHPPYIAHAHARRLAGKALVRHLRQAWLRDLRERAREFGGDQGYSVRVADQRGFVAADPIARDLNGRVRAADPQPVVAGDPIGDDQHDPVRAADLQIRVVPDPLARDPACTVRDADQNLAVAGDPLGGDHNHHVCDADHGQGVAADPLARDHKPFVRDADQAGAVAGDPLGDDHTTVVRDVDLKPPVVPDPLARDHQSLVRDADRGSVVAGEPTKPKPARVAAREKWLAIARKAAVA